MSISDPDGFFDVASVQLLLGTSNSAANACYVKYELSTNSVYLANDAGAWQTPLPVGKSGSSQNSQCVLDAGASSLTGSGTYGYVTFALSFKTAFGGVKNVYYTASDFAGSGGVWQTYYYTYNVAANNNLLHTAPTVSPVAAEWQRPKLHFHLHRSQLLRRHHHRVHAVRRLHGRDQFLLPPLRGERRQTLAGRRCRRLAGAGDRRGERHHQQLPLYALGGHGDLHELFA